MGNISQKKKRCKSIKLFEQNWAKLISLVQFHFLKHQTEPREFIGSNTGFTKNRSKLIQLNSRHKYSLLISFKAI
jgi:hypothetical protein